MIAGSPMLLVQSNLQQLEGDLAFLRGASDHMTQLSTHVRSFIAASHAKARQAAAQRQVRLLTGQDSAMLLSAGVQSMTITADRCLHLLVRTFGPGAVRPPVRWYDLMMKVLR